MAALLLSDDQVRALGGPLYPAVLAEMFVDDAGRIPAATGGAAAIGGPEISLGDGGSAVLADPPFAFTALLRPRRAP